MIAGEPGSTMAVMSRIDRITLMLELDLASEPIEGELRTVDGQSLAFVGWLGLTAALGRAAGGGTKATTLTTKEEHHVS